VLKEDNDFVNCFADAFRVDGHGWKAPVKEIPW
jgi:hypothetical protein